MKVTVTFGDTAVVVPCKAGWTVRDLVDQATRRYRRILEQHGQCAVKTHHLEYAEGGILDVDDMLIDLVEDRDKLVAVFDEVQAGRTASPSETMSNGYSSSASPEPLHYFPHLDYKEPIRGEIEVNEAVLKANTPLLVRSSSDSALAPTLPTAATPTPDENGKAPMEATGLPLRGTLFTLSDCTCLWLAVQRLLEDTLSKPAPGELGQREAGGGERESCCSPPVLFDIAVIKHNSGISRQPVNTMTEPIFAV